MKRKLLASFLTFAMLVSLVPSPALALDEQRAEWAVTASDPLDGDTALQTVPQGGGEPAPVERVQALIDALPGPEGITTENRANAVSGVQYLDCDANGQNWTTKTCSSATAVESGTTTWSSGWYVVNSNVTVGSRITVSGNVHLILTDGCKLTAESGGINVSSGNSLTIYAQSTGDSMGQLSAAGGQSQAGIGGGKQQSGGTITINGGSVTAIGGDKEFNNQKVDGGSGLGGGFNRGGTVIINGGSVTATGGGGAAGIGGGDFSESGEIKVSIYGGSVTAVGGVRAAGIGSGGDSTISISTMINGGTVTAIRGSGNRCDIGAGLDGKSGSFQTGENGNAIITGAIDDKSQQEIWSGVFFEGNAGQIYGSPTLTTNTEIPNGKTLTIPTGKTLTVPSGVTLTNSGTLKIDGTLTVNGTFTNNSTIQVKVALDANGGGTVSPDSVYVSFTSGGVSGLPTPTRSGFAFAGWYTAASGGDKIESMPPLTVTPGQTLYAHWTENQYTVTFDTQGGSVTTGSTHVTYGGTYGTLPTPTRSGYIFTGWYTAQSGGTQVESTTTVTITADQTLYAHWLKNTPYIDADGSAHDAGAVSVTDQTTWTTGWYVVDSSTTISSRITVSGDVKLILADGCTLTASQGISVNNPNSLTIYCQSGRTGALIATNPSGGGAAIGGSRKSGSGQDGQQAGTIVINGGNITATVPSANKGGACIGQSGWTNAGGTVTINGGYLKLSSKVGGEGAFGGGGTRTINGGVVEFTGTSSNRNTIDSVTKNNGIVFKESDGQVYGSTVLPFDYTIPSGKTLTIPEGKTLTVPAGTTLTNNGTLKIDGTLTANGTFTNSGTTQVKVALNANGGTVSPDSGYVSFASGGVSGLPTPTRSGFAFAGWYTAQSDGTKIESMTPLTLTPGQTLYAHWTVNQYTVTFDAQGGSVSSASKGVTYNDIYGELPTATREGYTFDGWYTAIGGGDKIESSTTVTVTADQTLYAHWTANQYAVTFDARGGSVSSASKKVTYNDIYGELPAPTREGYTFGGWYTAISGGDKIESSTKVTVTADQTLYAHWLKSAKYIDADGSMHDAGAVSVTDQTTWTTGWYVVDSSTTIGERITVSGDVKLILADGCTLTASQGINVSSGSSLTIYAQSTGNSMGKLTATGEYAQAGIGSDANMAGGVITINGGNVTARGGDYAAGIGGGSGLESGGVITINGGRVTANRRTPYGSFGAAIGGGNRSKGATITISGGIVTTNGQIGAGADPASGGTASNSFSTGTNGHAVIFSESISDTSGQGSWKGIIFLGDAGSIYGSSITLQDDLDIPSNKTLTIPAGATLTIDSGVTLTVTGDVDAKGTTVNKGTIIKKAQTAPNTPTASAQTVGSITLNTVSGGKCGVEYRCGDGEWQTGTVFDGLTAGTAYTFTVRYKGNEYYQEASSTATIYTTSAVPANPADCYTINYTAETVTAKTGYEISTNGTSGWKTGAVSVTPGSTIYVRAAVSGGAPASESVSSTLPDRPNVPTGTEACSIDTGTERITVNSGYEVNTSSGFGGGTAVTDGTKIDPGAVLYARKAATANSFCSTAQAITAPSRGTKPSVGINYTNETLTTTTAMEYTANGGTSWTACTSADMAATAFGWDGTAAVTVQFRTKATGSGYASEAADVTVPARPAAPGAKITVKKTDTSITVMNDADFNGCQFSIDDANWQDSKEFAGLTAGKSYSVSIRTKATGAAFASASQSVNVTTVNADGSTTVKPGESVEIGTPPGTTVTNDGEKTTITTGGTTTTITPAGEVEVGAGGGVSVPGGSTIQTGDGGPAIKLPQGGTIGGDGGVTLPGGGTAQVGPSTTITVPAGGGTVKPNAGGGVDVPGGSTVKTGDNGPEITIGDQGGAVSGDGGITVPEGGTVQTGKDPATTITPPTGGEVKPKGDGTVEVPEGTAVKPGNGGPEVTVGPGNSGTVGGDGGVTVPGGGKVTVQGDSGDTTITLPSGGGTVKPNSDGTIPLPGGSTVEKGGVTITVPDTGGTYDPDTGTMTGNVHTVTFDSQGGSAVSPATVTHGGTVTKPGDPTRSGYTFGGWYKDRSCTNAWDFDTDTVTGDVTLYAKWTADTPPVPAVYTVTFDSQGGSNVSPATVNADLKL